MMSYRRLAHVFALTLHCLFIFFAAVSAQDSGNTPQPRIWIYGSCLELKGVITIKHDGVTEEIPQDAKVCGYCDDNPLITLHWGENKYVIVFLKVGKVSNKFEVMQLEYFEGGSGWYANLAGFRGLVGGKVVCTHVTTLNLKYDGASTNENHGCTDTEASAKPEGDQDAANPEVDQDAKGDLDAANPGGDKDVTNPEGDEDAANHGGDKDAASPASDPENNPQPRSSDATASKRKRDTIREDSMSGCRVEPDLALTLGVSGAVTAAVLLAAAAVAVRVFS